MYDVIVLGTGGVGSATAFHLASRGAKVLGIDRFPGGHNRGSSHGETRVIRQAYYEHADYVPLLLRAYELWHELEDRCGIDLLHQIGLLQIGPPGGNVIRGVLQAARQHGLSLDELTAGELTKRFPGFRLPEGYAAAFESAAGYLRVERCVLAHLAAAKNCGTELRFGDAVRSWSATDRQVSIVTESGDALHASSLIITAGPWAPRLLADIGIRLSVRRKHLYWFPVADAHYTADGGCPTFIYELPHGIFYGIAAIDEQGLKTGEHSGGQTIDDPLSDPRLLDPADLARVQEFTEHLLPGVSRQPSRHSVCFYTMSPDEHFLVDRHPRHANVFFAAGLSGHGFKFTSVLGQALTELALIGKSSLPIDFLSLRRFSPT